jgi:dienelactone hydrolase
MRQNNLEKTPMPSHPAVLRAETLERLPADRPGPLARPSTIAVATALALAAAGAQAQAPTPTGEVQGTAWAHTQESLSSTVDQADVCLPATATGGQPFVGKFKDAPAAAGSKVPVILFLHGSSGLGLKAIGEWQAWLCGLGYASVAPDSFALPGRVTYKSPIDKDAYERIHALRASEIDPALQAIQRQPWADPGRLVLAGTSEGAVPVARYAGAAFKARMLFAWSCEPNYFVTAPRNAFEMNKPVLNIISATDPFFSKSNAWLGNGEAQGHCGAALATNPQASVLLIPNAPHTLLNLPAARSATAGFLSTL